MPKVVQIAVSQVSHAADKLYSYAVPADMEELAVPGVRALVPFGQGSRAREGIILGTGDSAPVRLREVRKILDESPVLDDRALRLAAFLKKRYFCTWYEAVKPLLPPGSGVTLYEWILFPEESREGAFQRYEKSPVKRRILELLCDAGGSQEYSALKKTAGISSLRQHVQAMAKSGAIEITYREKQQTGDKTIRVAKLGTDQATALDFSQEALKSAPVQAKMIEILIENEAVSVKDLLFLSGGSHSSLRSLEKKGLICLEQYIVERQLEQKAAKRAAHFEPTEDQARVIAEISSGIEGGGDLYYLLQGVTGSGKTEVYLQLIQKVLDLGRQAIVLVPEIALTPQTVLRFRQRFGDAVAVLHSGLSLGERYGQWKKIKEGRVSVAVGARSCVFAPFSNLGMIVMDEEHETTYQSESSPRYDTREVAAYRAKQYGAVLLMASATPSVESRYACDRGTCRLLAMTARYNENRMPKMLIADMRGELSSGNPSIFSRMLQKEIQSNLESGQQTILFLNRRGFSTFVSCRSCGYVMTCPNCSISLTYHKKTRSMQCHYCSHRAPQPNICPECKSRQIKFFGIGTQRVEEEVHKLFPQATTLRMDMDTTASKFSHEKILDKFRKDRVDILIGTQMVSKGLDFDQVTLVGVIAADMSLNSDDYRCCERTFSQIVQVSGRAGRGAVLGRSVVQTYQPDSYAIQLAATQDYERFYQNEINFRKRLNYPPFCDIITVFFTGAMEHAVEEAALSFHRLFRDAVRPYQDQFSVMAPHPSSVYKVSGKFRWLFSVKCPKHADMARVLAPALEAYYQDRRFDGVTASVCVNPANLY